MKTIKLIPTFLIFIFLLAFPEQAGAQYQVPRSVSGNGGVPLSNNRYRLNGTAGQSAIGVVSSRSHIKEVGFWYQYITLITSVEQISNRLPTEFRLEQNYPNPFNPATTIAFAIPKRSSVTLKLFDILGREVATLLDIHLQPGEFKIVIDAKDFPTGVYFYRLQAEGFIQTKRFLLLK